MCQIDGCVKKVLGRGWCSMHYSRWYRNGNPLWSSSQPKGQRVEDKIAWAKEILAQYSELV